MAIVINKRIPARPEADIPTHSKSDNKLWHLLTECWAYEPEHRPNAEKAQIMVGFSVALVGTVTDNYSTKPLDVGYH